MFIVILIFVQFNYKNSIAAAYNNYEHEKNAEATYNDSTIGNTRINTATMLPKTLFEITKFRINNMKDLKANIFDKMLSDEMLSIQHHIYEKNITSPVTLRLSTKRYVPTPILEVRQRWPIDRLQSNKENKKDLEKHTKSIDNREDFLETNEQVEYNCKRKCSSDRVLELRSLSEKLQKIDLPTKSPRMMKKCTCCNALEHSPISVQKNKNQILSHKEHEQHPSSPHECTRTGLKSSPAAYPFYVPYSPYFIATVADYGNFYYHPDTISDLKKPNNHKNRKPATEEINDSYEDGKDYDDYSQAHDYHTKRTRKHKDGRKNKIKPIYYTTNEPDSNLINYKDNIQAVDKDNFVEEIVKDLKMYYKEAVIKDCYCSASSFKPLYLLHFVIAIII